MDKSVKLLGSEEEDELHTDGEEEVVTDEIMRS
jgi:hypothetical protein